MIERAPFGRTGHRSSRVVFGAAALSSGSQEHADEVLAVLDHFGVNHIDTAAGYGDSELRIGPWMARRRSEFFLATKTGDRGGDEARASLERSLQRLQTDHVDLVQLHNLVEEDEWAAAFAPGGAVEALARARDEGLTRFIGVTGHGLRIAAMHRRSLERFDFDSVLFPYSYVLTRRPAYRAEVEALLATCSERAVAVQTIKSAARRRWTESDTGPRHSWYQPIGDEAALSRSVRWVLGHPGLFVNSSSDTRLLPAILEAASAAPVAPADLEPHLDADLVAEGITALFDGGALERI